MESLFQGVHREWGAIFNSLAGHSKSKRLLRVPDREYVFPQRSCHFSVGTGGSQKAFPRGRQRQKTSDSSC